MDKRKLKYIFALLVCLSICYSSMFVYAADMNNMNSIEMDTIVEYPVENGNLYFGHYTFDDESQKSEKIHLIGADETVTEAVVPETINDLTVDMITQSAFLNCINLQKVEIPKTVTIIDQTAFAYCDELIQINVADENPNYYSVEGALFERNIYGDFMLRYPAKSMNTSFEIPDDTVYVCAYCFSGAKNLSVVKIPNTVTNIDYMAFQGCENLADIYYAGSFSQWQRITEINEDDVLLIANIHCNEMVQQMEEGIEKISETKVTQVASEAPMFFFIFSYFSVIVLVIGVVLFFMKNDLKERKRYLNYQKEIQRKWNSEELTYMYCSDSILKRENRSLSKRILQKIGILLIFIIVSNAIWVICLQSKIDRLNWLHSIIPLASIRDKITQYVTFSMFIPVLIILILVVMLLLGGLMVWLVFKIKDKLFKQNEDMEIPIRIRSIGEEKYYDE